MERYTLDRIEDGVAVLLLRSDETIQKNIQASLLPGGVKEGDILEIKFDGDKIQKASILKSETEDAKKKAQDLLQKILDKNR